MKWIDLPPVWLLGSMALMWTIAEFAPWPGIEAPWIGRAVIALSLAVMVWTAISFRRRRTTIVPHMQPNALVTDGPMRFSRNPIYAADAAILVGWGLGLGAAAAFVVVPLFVAVIERRFILAEEARLEAAFGADFLAYKAQVRRWL